MHNPAAFGKIYNIKKKNYMTLKNVFIYLSKENY